MVSGQSVYSKLKYESVLTVLNVPVTESKVVHISTATVLLCQKKKLTRNRSKDLRGYYHASGAGGQTSTVLVTVVRMVHIPTGKVGMQEERTQQKP